MKVLIACEYSGRVREALLRGMGYKIVYYPNPYPGNPSDYTTISW